ncbi:hypothetical protein CLIB1423_08S02388 [[Candida] railenensis]|uniref:DUF1479-domain-containing protein n=1 Tax=[Candida] railenensis TaxID=45579 RepID=A0A9P0QQ47_9ASCO|nr:hypothetical protein CLIB1423_08S02388 [[Candida] railenensis]
MAPIAAISPDSNIHTPPDLDPVYSKLKQRLVRKQDVSAVKESWKRLLIALESEVTKISTQGSSYVPSVQWEDIRKNNYQIPDSASKLFKERGALMVKGLVDEQKIDKWFHELTDFCKEHPETAGYTYPNPAAWYNLFWTKPQSEARNHDNVRKLFKAMSNQFYVEDEENSLIDLDTNIVYGDRIRIREPGQSAALKLHLDSGSIERWEDEKYRATYKEIFEGNWEDWDPFKLDERQFAHEDLYTYLDTKRPTICSSFRTLQGWLALSNNKTGEGTLKVLPSLKLAITYVLLRPLFWKDPESGNLDDYEIDLETPKFPGATPSTGQLFLLDEFYPHLNQAKSVVGIPDVNKGDFVFWHADILHEVDKEHNGSGHSSVFYYGVTPLSITNIPTLLDTKDAFTRNVSPEDYRSQLPKDTVEFQGADVKDIPDREGLQSMGLEEFDITDDLKPNQRKIRQIANDALKSGKFELSKYLS